MLICNLSGVHPLEGPFTRLPPCRGYLHSPGQRRAVGPSQLPRSSPGHMAGMVGGMGAGCRVSSLWKSHHSPYWARKHLPADAVLCSCNYCVLCSSFVLAACFWILLVPLPVPVDRGSLSSGWLLLLFSKCHCLLWCGCMSTEVTAQNVARDSQGCSPHG